MTHKSAMCVMRQSTIDYGRLKQRNDDLIEAIEYLLGSSSFHTNFPNEADRLEAAIEKAKGQS